MENPDKIFCMLKEILDPYASSMVVAIDKADNFFLNTHHVMKNKKPMNFSSVKINKSYVSFHLMPVYVFPELLDSISSELKNECKVNHALTLKQRMRNSLKSLVN